jgi:GTP cyclohydrolase II
MEQGLELGFLRPLRFEQRAFRRRFVNRPFVTLSYAQSLDGSIATEPGKPCALSSRAALVMTHALRACHQALLVGVETILADDPRLNVRYVAGEDPRPVILDSYLRFPPTARVLSASRQKPWLFTSDAASEVRAKRLQSLGIRLFRVPEEAPGRLDLIAVLRCLARAGIGTLMVEGGGCVIQAFLRRQLVDYCVLTIAPRFVGGVKAIAARMEVLLVNLRYQPLGGDMIVFGRVAYRPWKL